MFYDILFGEAVSVICHFKYTSVYWFKNMIIHILYNL